MSKKYWLSQFWKDKEVTESKDTVPFDDHNALELMIAELTDMRDRWYKRHNKRESSLVVRKLTNTKEWLESVQKDIKEEI